MKKIFGLLLLFVPVLSFAQLTKGKSIDGVISKVDNHYILRSDLDQMYYQYQAENQKNAPSKCQCLNSLIINKVMLAKAEIDSVTVEDRQVEGEHSSGSRPDTDNTSDPDPTAEYNGYPLY